MEDAAEKAQALDRVLDQAMPGRSAEARARTAHEPKATGVVALDVEAVTMKRRPGRPVDDAEDLVAGTWGGVLPVAGAVGRGVADAHTPRHVE